MNRNLHAKHGMKYRVDWTGWLITLFLLVLLLSAWLFASWVDTQAERARLSKLEQGTIGLLNGVTMRTGPNDYVTCRQVHLIPGVDETGI